MDKTCKFILDYTLEHGWGPSYRDIARHFGIRIQAAWDRIRVRERAGLVSTDHRFRSRTIRVHALGLVR